MIIRPGVWNYETEHLIDSALSSATLDDIKRQVKDGAQLFVLQDEDAETLGAFVLRIDHMSDRNEGVIVAAAGSVNGVDLTDQMIPVVEKMFVGCQSMRIHTRRLGLVKKLARQGFDGAEIVLRKALNNGR